MWTGSGLLGCVVDVAGGCVGGSKSSELMASCVGVSCVVEVSALCIGGASAASCGLGEAFVSSSFPQTGRGCGVLGCTWV